MNSPGSLANRTGTIRRATATALGAALLLGAAACGGAADLSYRGEKGAVSRWKRVLRHEGKHPSGESAYTQVELYTEETVVEVDRRKAHVRRIRFVRTAAEAKRESMETALRYDSTDPESAKYAFARERGAGFGQMAGVMSRLVGAEVDANVTVDGRVDRFLGLEGLKQHLVAGLEDPAVQEAAARGAEPTLLRVLLQPPCKVVTRGVAAGETWRFVDIRRGPEDTAGIPFQMYVVGNQKVESLDDGVARMTFTGTAVLDPPEGATPIPEFLAPFRKWLRLDKGTLTGEVRMDTATGTLVSGRVVTDLDLVATSDRPGPRLPPPEDGGPAPTPLPPPEVRIPQKIVETIERWEEKAK
jgi:hypothetical protein